MTRHSSEYYICGSLAGALDPQPLKIQLMNLKYQFLNVSQMAAKFKMQICLSKIYLLSTLLSWDYY